MRCDNDFWLSPEWMVCSGWFRREGVEARTRQMSATDCIKQSSFIYQTAARRVDDVSAPGQLGDGRRVDDSARLLCKRAMQADRKGVVSGKSVSVRVVLGGRRHIKKKQK